MKRKQVKDDGGGKGLKRKKKQQQEEFFNEFGTNIYKCSGVNYRDVNYNYHDSYSVILKTWSDQLRGPSKKINLKKKKKKKKKNTLKATRGGFGFAALHKVSIRIKKGTLKVGDKVNLSRILFTKHRDFLVTKDRNRPVQAKHLKGKVVILHFVPLVPWDYILMRQVTSLVDIYDELHPQGVEVVFVGVGTSESHELSLEECFEEKFSIMPWTAIPLPDDIMKSQTYLEKKLRFNFSKYATWSQTVSLVIDPAGVVLQLNAADYIVEYGARAFPFNYQRIQRLIYEEEQALKHPSITNLLTTPRCNYVINRHNQAVPVCDLEDKVVAIYFYENYQLNDLTELLKWAYQQLSKKENFEIVLAYIHDSIDAYDLESEESFWETFRTMPWLALPYRDPRSKFLKRMFSYPLTLDGPGPDPRLLVIGPQGKFVEPYGVDILQKFGISAYPFSRKRVAEVEAKYARKLKLDMILDVDTCFIQKDGHKVKLSQLVGKRIIFMIDDGWATIFTSFCRRLKERYLQMKDTDDEFEVIHVPNKYMNSSFGEYVATMPWLTCSPSRLENNILRRLFRQGVGLLAFNGKGRVVRRAMFPSLERGNMDFPFYAGSLEEEAFTELISYFNWDSWLHRLPRDC